MGPRVACSVRVVDMRCLSFSLQIWLEMEIGITGGEEDGVDNTGEDQNKLYTQPEQVQDVEGGAGSLWLNPLGTQNNKHYIQYKN